MNTIKMQVIVSKELAQRFRETAGRKFGARKGTISKAFTQALEEWIEKEAEKVK